MRHVPEAAGPRHARLCLLRFHGAGQCRPPVRGEREACGHACPLHLLCGFRDAAGAGRRSHPGSGRPCDAGWAVACWAVAGRGAGACQHKQQQRQQRVYHLRAGDVRPLPPWGCGDGRHLRLLLPQADKGQQRAGKDRSRADARNVARAGVSIGLHQATPHTPPPPSLIRAATIKYNLRCGESIPSTHVCVPPSLLCLFLSFSLAYTCTSLGGDGVPDMALPCRYFDRHTRMRSLCYMKPAPYTPPLPFAPPSPPLVAVSSAVFNHNFSPSPPPSCQPPPPASSPFCLRFSAINTRLCAPPRSPRGPNPYLPFTASPFPSPPPPFDVPQSRYLEH
eukprot:Rhum_TRINITY_DN14249_c6_g2::Rhum_TRINITY_DN14249_c6_g2_i1::g.76900::m.76900